MSDRLDGARVLIYSHDTFGLGHLRRCRAIAHALVERYKGVSVLILSGSPIIGSYDFRARVDFVRIPGVIKLHNGEYTSLGLHIDLEETLAIRASVIRHTAEIFAPDLIIVDKEPLGLNGEVLETLALMKSHGSSLVLGLRDVMDEPTLLSREWDHKKVLPALESLYDEIWVYGLEDIWNPLQGMAIPDTVNRKMIYTGYLPRVVPTASSLRSMTRMRQPYILVTAGGGGDGVGLIDWVLRAYEHDPTLPHRALLVLGPFMPPAMQTEFRDRASRLSRVKTITFDSHVEVLMANAAGIVAMGGYNTFCEILSLDKRAVIVPRSQPRQEQLIRARRAKELGLAEMLEDDGKRDPAVMAAALHSLPQQSKPSQVMAPGLLGGLEAVARLAEHQILSRSRQVPSYAFSRI